MEPLVHSEPHLNLRMLVPLVRWVEHHHGVEALQRAAAAAGIPVEELRRGNSWVNLEAAENVHSYVFDLLGQDETAFRQVAGNALADAYGPMRFIIWATSPKAVYLRAMRTIHLISRISRYEVVAGGGNWLRARYHSDQPESRLMCLSRQGTIAAITTLWGLPTARITEHSCIGRGDSCCDYEVRWRPRSRLLPAVIGGAAGGAVAALLCILEPWSWTCAVWVALGAALGQLREVSRYHRAQVAVEEESQEALRQMADEEGMARRELAELHQRQSAWLGLVEQEVGERTSALQAIIGQLRTLQEDRATAIRGFSHDLNNPLMVCRSLVSLLREECADGSLDVEKLDEDLRTIVEAHGEVEQRLSKMMEFVLAESRHERLVVATIDTATLADELRRRLRAMLIGRPVAVTVFSTREAPASVSTDRLVFDRVLDNLLTNAAKYTSEGSIVVEISGAPGFLLLKVSDTGRGIADTEIERIFRANGSAADNRAPRSYGLGLSVVVRLLNRVGGRLEVLSKPNVGTTFWLYFPTELPAQDEAHAEHDELMARVVRIRRSTGE
jgi:signal transduction histidine kinase